MVQQMAPAKTIQTVEGLIMAKICSSEGECVLTEVLGHMRIFDDGRWFCAFWDADDEERSETVLGADKRETEAIGRILTAISSLAPVRP